ncbi:MAG: hypothetical protein IPH18_01485 [Chitinophagaceae bacterium]|nr:hypothetical protein [Chitinophagaceae bacterium]
MKKSIFICAFVQLSLFINAQRIHVGVFGGAAAYNGDLTSAIFPKKVTNGAVGITASYEVTEKVLVRLGGTYAIVGGADRFNKDTGIQARNLAFETVIVEGSLLGEYYLFNLYERKISPYFFAGLAFLKYDPYAYQGSQKVYLKPLSTEGQGITGYPDRKPYSPHSICSTFWRRN